MRNAEVKWSKMTVGKSLHCDPSLSRSTAESSFWGDILFIVFWWWWLLSRDIHMHAVICPVISTCMQSFVPWYPHACSHSSRDIHMHAVICPVISTCMQSFVPWYPYACSHLSRDIHTHAVICPVISTRMQSFVPWQPHACSHSSRDIHMHAVICPVISTCMQSFVPASLESPPTLICPLPTKPIYHTIIAQNYWHIKQQYKKPLGAQTDVIFVK